MKRPSEYMIMTDGVTRHDYERELNKYIDHLEAENKTVINNVGNVHLRLPRPAEAYKKALEVESFSEFCEWYLEQESRGK